MIDSAVPATYAQYGEDLVLRALLASVEKGFYVDIGANDPHVDSVTKLFYEAGWRGINVEPIRKLIGLFERNRPRDINLHMGVSDQHGNLTFREYADTSGHSTFSKNQMDHEAKEAQYTEYQIKVITLTQLFKDYVGGQKVDFLKIDVEGLEYEVVCGNDWMANRPRVICIEANHKNPAKDWDAILTIANYREFIFDGLNAYYVAAEEWKLTEGYSERIVALSHAALRPHRKDIWLEDSDHIRRLLEYVELLKGRLEACEKERDTLRATTLNGQPLRVRIGRAIRGVTIGWWREKRIKNI